MIWLAITAQGQVFQDNFDRVNADHPIDFLGHSWPISATARQTVTLIHHPLSQFWVVSQPPKPPLNRWPDILGKFSL